MTGAIMFVCVGSGGTAPAAAQLQRADTQAERAATLWASHFATPYSRATSGLVLALSGLGCGGRDVVGPQFADMSEDTIGSVEACLGTRVDRSWSVVVTSASMDGRSPIEEHAHFREKGRRAILDLSMTSQELEEVGLAVFEHHVVYGELRGSLGLEEQIYGISLKWRGDKTCGVTSCSCRSAFRPMLSKPRLRPRPLRTQCLRRRLRLVPRRWASRARLTARRSSSCAMTPPTCGTRPVQRTHRQ